jgi:hypothetical protein
MADIKTPKLDADELKERRSVAWDYWAPHRKGWHANMKMYAPDAIEGQWDTDAKRMRDDKDRPSLTMNMLAQPVHQIVNSARQNRIGPRLVPVDGRADKDMAQVFEDWIRSIDYQSSAHVADEYALEMAAAASYGFIGLGWEWANPNASGKGAFEKRLIVYRIPDPAKVLADPFSIEPNGMDAEWYCIEHHLSKEEYERSWPDEDPEDGDFEIQSSYENIRVEDRANVLEYHTKHRGEKQTKFLLSDGREIVGEERAKHEAGLFPGVEILGDRDFHETSVWKHITNGKKDLEEPSRWFDDECIPIIPVWGKELWVRGKRTLRSVLQDSSEPQQFVNYMVTKAAEMAGRASLSPAVVDPRGIANHPEWATAATEAHPYLRYNLFDTETNQPIPGPLYNQYDLAVQGLSLLIEQGKALIDGTHGVHPSGRGEKEPGINSGRQTLALQQNTDMANFHVPDNLARAVEQRYRIMLRVLPRMLAEGAVSVERAIRVIGDDKTEQIVQVFMAVKGQTADFDGPAMRFKAKGPNGMEEKIAPLDPGMYDVRVHAGKSLSTRRQEKFFNLIEIRKTLTPEMQAVTASDMMLAMDIPDGEKMAEKLERTLPPHLKEPTEGEPQIPPEVQQQMQQMQQALQAMDKELQKNEFEKQAKMAELQGRSAIEEGKAEVSKEIAAINAEVKVLIAQMQDEGQERRNTQALMVDVAKALETLRQPTHGYDETSGELQPIGPTPAL